MHSILMISLLAAVAGPVRFERHEIAEFRAGYQVAVSDMNGDGKPDVIALSTDANRVDWFENPTWKPHPVAQMPKNIDLAPHDVDGDGRPEIALASGFYFAESTRGGEIHWFSRPATPDALWQPHFIATDPVAHRIRWGDLDGDGRKELIHAPIFGPGSKWPGGLKPAHLWAFRLPKNPADSPWETWKIDETLTVLHGIHVSDMDNDGRDEILTASFEGIYRFDFEGRGSSGSWKKVHISPGAEPVSNAPGASRGTSEVESGKLGRDKKFIAAIEPWHGKQVVVYTQAAKDGPWQRRVLDTTLNEGHALAVADFDGDGMDEIVAGWRAGGGGLALFDPVDATGERFTKIEIERGVAAECVVAADMNGDGKPDLVVTAGRNNKILWYENK